MDRLTDEQVKQQAKNFTDLLGRCNYQKAGKIFLKMQLNDNHDGRYNEYNFLCRYLKVNCQ